MNIGRCVDLALVFRQTQAIRVPAQRPLARFCIDRQAEEVDQLRTQPALGIVFVHSGTPDAGKIHLSNRGNTDQGRQREQSQSAMKIQHKLASGTFYVKRMPRSIWSESLSSFSDALAATRPAPAGVTAAAVAAELGISLMIKAMSITGGHDDLVEAARREAAHLRGAADDDIGAVMEYMQTAMPPLAGKRSRLLCGRAGRGRGLGIVREGFGRGKAIAGCGPTCSRGPDCRRSAGNPPVHQRQLKGPRRQNIATRSPRPSRLRTGPATLVYTRAERSPPCARFFPSCWHGRARFRSATLAHSHLGDPRRQRIPDVSQRHLSDDGRNPAQDGHLSPPHRDDSAAHHHLHARRILGGGQQGRRHPELLPWMEMGWNVVNVEYRLGPGTLAPGAWRIASARCATSPSKP